MRYEVVISTPRETQRVPGSPTFATQADAEAWAQEKFPFVTAGLEAIIVRAVQEQGNA
ncbi:hypothetical protein GCM10011611_18350 [Aliidongia dinghuensis]|uniref:Uncharacterized protein n=1 Tax=Aliidongia dinghuensis TaxID=1867774 RepID=A0A8J2YSB5_9PROT|nr:hypothetical protein GCM10011611_18350 [Aliidongia dinghuensis]